MYLLLGYGKSNKSIEQYFINNNIYYIIYDDIINNKKINNININTITCVIKSNGIKNEHPLLLKAKENNIKIISDLQLFYEITNNKNYVLVTGSNGKTTTVSLLEKCLLNTISIGNNGLPFFDYVNDSRNKILEVSSFMLEYIDNINFKYNIITNIYPTHLEHHKTYINYIKAKTNFLKNLNKDNYIIYNKDDVLLNRIISNYDLNKITISLYDKNATIYLKDNYIYYLDDKVININNIKLLGEHNIINIMLLLGVILNNKQYLKHNYKDEIYNYTGEKITPKIKITCGNLLLIENNDYTLSYENNIESIRRSLNQRCAKIAALEALSADNTEMNIKRIADQAALKRAETKAAAILNLPIKAEIAEYQ